MMQKRFAGMANRAFRIVAACAVLLMTAGVCSCGGKAGAQGGSTASAAGAQKAETKAGKKAGGMSVDKLKKQKPAPESDFEVRPTDDSYTAIRITKYKGNDQVVVIPATMQGLPVKEIGTHAFEYNKDIVAVVIPEGVTVIHRYAFNDCPNLSVAVISEGVTCIADSSFSGCKSLSSVVLPSTLVAIETCAFSCCSSLTSINLPEGLMLIGGDAFSGSGLTSVSLPKSLRLMVKEAFGYDLNPCDSLAEIQIPADHAISSNNYGFERTFDPYFYGTKIKESIALQKLLKETKTRKISRDEYDSIRADIAKKVGAESLDSDFLYFKW